MILAGGWGKRLWPLSHTLHPKQFLTLVGNRSLFQETLLRIQSLPAVKKSIIITHESQYFICRDQMQEIERKPTIFILEPVSRNTAPALALAAHTLSKEDIILVLPADHVIENAKSFCHLINRALPTAKKGYLVTFGITPTFPSTGFGYIQIGDPLDPLSFKVNKFTEKPSRKKACSFLSDKHCFWNSGIFLMPVGLYLEELEKSSPRIFEVSKKAYSLGEKRADYIRVHKKLFQTCPTRSIDYAVMQRTQSAAMVPMNLPWKDLGCWDALVEENGKNQQKKKAGGCIITRECSGCLLSSENRVPLVAIGIKDQVIVSTKRGLLVAHKRHTDKIKEILNTLKHSPLK